MLLMLKVAIFTVRASIRNASRPERVCKQARRALIPIMIDRDNQAPAP
jgi:hypothetical protein